MFSFRNIHRLRPLVTAHIQAGAIIRCSNEKCATELVNTQYLPATQFIFVRSYAKHKDKQKEKARDKGIKFAKFQLNDEQLSTIIDIGKYNEHLQKALDALQNEFIQNLSLRSTTGSIESLKINVDGKEHELQELAQIIRKNPKTIVVNLVSFPQTIPATLVALQKSGMNLNPQQEGTTIFIPVPKVTKEHRENLSKNAKMLFVKCRTAIKDTQNAAIKKVKRNTEISQDDSFSVQGQLTSIADKFVEKADQMLAVKQKELLGGS